MNVINIDEECHGHIGIAADYQAAISFLVNKNWLASFTEVYAIDDKWRSLKDMFGDEWEKTIRSWTLNQFNEVFDGCFYLRDEPLYNGTDENEDE